jgi:hypothetical protein
VVSPEIRFQGFGGETTPIQFQDWGLRSNPENPLKRKERNDKFGHEGMKIKIIPGRRRSWLGSTR